MAKKRPLWKAIALVSALAMLLAGLAACSQSAAPTPPATDASSAAPGAAATTAAAVTEPERDVTLKLIGWTNPATTDALTALNEAFHQAHPTYKVEMNQVDTNQWPEFSKTRIAAKDFDICMGTPIEPPADFVKGTEPPEMYTLLDNGVSLDLTGQPFLKNWNQNAINNVCTYKGKVYCVVTGYIGFNGIFYNKTMFDENGWKVPETWDEFVALCDAIRAKGIDPMTGGGKDGWPVGMMLNAFVGTMEPDPYAFSKGLWTGERKWNDAQFVKVYERMDKFLSYYEPGFTGLDYNSALGRFQAGLVPMYAGGTWDGATIEKDPEFKFGYFCIPGDTKGSEPYQLQGRYDMTYSILAASPNTKEALQWLDFLSQKENFEKFENTQGMIPTMDGINMTDPFTNSLAPINVHPTLNFQRMYWTPAGLGQYAGFESSFANLKGAGGSLTPQELADKSQADWDAAMAALPK